MLGGALFRQGKLEREMCDSCFEVDVLKKKKLHIKTKRNVFFFFEKTKEILFEQPFYGQLV